ncbi:MAG: OadG family protein [Dehalococcoidales bacterium]|nr:MAG: OadG family protein [Dehalococcoidales bacterium]
MIDWAFAGKIGGIGFGMVFAVLVILAVVLWLTGMIFKKIEAGSKDTGDDKKGA